MNPLTTQHSLALQLLMTDDIYIIPEKNLPTEAVLENQVLPEKTISVEDTISVKSFEYMGENNKYFLILVDDKTHKDLNNTLKEMLLKIMLAKGLELRDIAILNLHRYPKAVFSDLKDFFVSNRMVLFGISPQQIGLPSISVNEPGKYLNVKVLATYSLEEMKNEVEKKKVFWNVMKPF